MCDLLTATGATAVFVVGAALARRPEVSRRELRWFEHVNGLPGRWFPPVWTVMQLGSLGGVGVAAAAAARFEGVAAGRRAGISGASAWAAAKLVKPFVQRGRPVSVVTTARVLGRHQTGLGYPSGHTAVACAMAVATAPLLSARGRRVVWLLPPVVGGARLYVGAHLPLDVLGGAALGVACGSALRLFSPEAQRSMVTPSSSRRAWRTSRREASVTASFSSSTSEMCGPRSKSNE